MEAAENSVILAILAGAGQPRPTTRKQRARREYPAHAPVRQRASKHEQCYCGECPRCLENARWERIFAEKFADPDYYEPKPIRYCSPLAPSR